MFGRFCVLRYPTDDFHFFHKHAIALTRLSFRSTQYRKFRDILHYYGMHEISWITIAFCEEGFYEMARNKDFEFVNCTLSSEDEGPLVKLGEKYNNELTLVIEAILSKGYTIKTGFYPESEAYGVFIGATDETPVNKGKLLSSWSDDLGEALLMCLYKIDVIFKGGKWDTGETRKGKWG